MASIGTAFGSDLRLFETWGQLTVLSLRDSASVHVPATPMGVDIGRVGAAERIVDQVVERLGQPARPVSTGEAFLPGGDYDLETLAASPAILAWLKA